MQNNDRLVTEIPQLRRYACFLTRDVSAAEDLIQDTLVLGISKMHLWKEGSNLGAWLSTLLYHQYINRVRRAARERAILGELGRESASSCAAGQEVRLELLDLSRALDRLPAEQRAVLLQVGIEESRPVEMAKTFGIPVGTIRTRLFRGRAKLHRRFSQPKAIPRAVHG